MTLTCTRVRRSRFIHRDIVFNIKTDEHGLGHEISVQLRKEMMDLGLAFFRNRVELRFTRGKKDSLKDMEKIREDIQEFCDTKLSGYWTWKLKTRNADYDLQSVEIDVMFEIEEDLELFLKDCATIVRLTY